MLPGFDLHLLFGGGCSYLRDGRLCSGLRGRWEKKKRNNCIFFNSSFFNSFVLCLFRFRYEEVVDAFVAEGIGFEALCRTQVLLMYGWGRRQGRGDGCFFFLNHLMGVFFFNSFVFVGLPILNECMAL